MYQKIKALVLRITDYNDRDALLTVLTRKHGKLTIKARGLRRKSSPLTAACQLLAYGEFTLFEYRGMYTINEAVSLEFFEGLRRDLDKLSLGTYFAQVAEVLSQEDLPNPELQALTLNCLYALSKTALPHPLIKAVFELRAVCLAGYLPDLTGCHECGNFYPDRFDLSAGVLECSTCRDISSGGIRMPVTPGVIDAMRYITECEPGRIFSFSVSAETLKSLGQLTESFLTTQLERGFSTLDFYKSLLFSAQAVKGQNNEE